MKTFTKTPEDFICEKCNRKITGNGYTNHCPYCLYSKDVDINPGDRASTCGGLMRPVSIAAQHDHFIITHKCEKCGKQRRQKSNGNDDINTIIEISKNNGFIFGVKN